FTMLKVPDSAVANFLLNSLNQSTPYQWQAETIRLGFFPFPHLKVEKLNLDPKFPGAGPALAVEEFRVYPNPFSLLPLGGPPAFGGSFRAEAYKANFHGYFAAGSDVKLRVETANADLAKFLPLNPTGSDLKGNITNLFIQILLPSQRASLADGEISVQGKNVAIDPSMFQLPIALPILNLGELDIQGSVSRGQVKITKFKLGSPGKDLELQIPNGSITLSDVTPNTRYDLHLLIKPSGAIIAAVPGITAMLDSMATRKPDGFYGLRLQGSLAAPGFPSKD
ncbi:MAG TPA: type II secretion system protein GspN, partial [Bdellovibrionota bacterium]